VEVFIRNFQVNPDEIQEADLMDDHPIKEMQVEEVPVENNHIQLGFVEIQEPDYDPVFVERSTHFRNNADVVRMWAQFFAPGTSDPTVSVTNIWADFFTSMLINTNSFPWARQMLSSLAWKLFTKNDFDWVHFALPDKCSNITAPCMKNLPTPDSLINVF
jgi:hypothetical protein